MKCPACFAHLPRVPTKVVCVGTCAPKSNKQATAVRGYDVKTKPIFDVGDAPAPGAPLAPTECSACSTPSTAEVCGYCSYPIPLNWRASLVTCVAMAGARATGKSLLLAVAKEQLELLTERHHRSAFRGVGDTERFFEENYTRPLFEQRRLLQATVGMSVSDTVTKEPLIFQFTERLADGSARSRVLVLRDVAGEDLEALGGMDRYLSFFSRADAVIALLDPLTVKQIQAMLADLIPAAPRLGGDGLAVIQHVLGLMTNHAPGARTRIPMAVVLSKVDVLQKLREVRGTKWASIMNRPGSPLQRDPSLMTANFDEVEGDLLHEELRGLLQELNAVTLTAMLGETADRFRYFAVSALGESPEGDMVNAGGIAPFRVLDPFKWALQVTA
jgi:hypothetical protein